METQGGKRKAEIGLPTLSRQQKRARVHLFRDSCIAKWPYIVPSECDDYAFCKVCDDSFSVAHGGGNDVIVTVSHGHIAELNLNKLKTFVCYLGTVREFCAPPSKTAESKVVSITRGTNYSPGLA